MLPVLFSRPSISMWARLHRQFMIADGSWSRDGGAACLRPTRASVVSVSETIQFGGSPRSEAQARELLAALAIRLANCKLELHAEDEDRLLQGCQRARHLSGVSLRLSGVYVSAPASEGEEGEVVRRVHAGVEQRGRPGVCGRPCAAGGCICGMTSRWRR